MAFSPGCHSSRDLRSRVTSTRPLVNSRTRGAGLRATITAPGSSVTAWYPIRSRTFLAAARERRRKRGPRDPRLRSAGALPPLIGGKIPASAVVAPPRRASDHVVALAAEADDVAAVREDVVAAAELHVEVVLAPLDAARVHLDGLARLQDLAVLERVAEDVRVAVGVVVQLEDRAVEVDRLTAHVDDGDRLRRRRAHVDLQLALARVAAGADAGIGHRRAQVALG